MFELTPCLEKNRQSEMRIERTEKKDAPGSRGEQMRIVRLGKNALFLGAQGALAVGHDVLVVIDLVLQAL